MGIVSYSLRKWATSKNYRQIQSLRKDEPADLGRRGSVVVPLSERNKMIDNISLLISGGLHRKQLSIEAIPADEIIVGTLVRDRALAEDNDPVRHSHCGEAV